MPALPPIDLPLDEIEITAVRSQGAGGQNVNKVASAAHLRFDIAASSLPAALRQRLLQSGDQRISKDGVIIIKAQEFRSLEKNRSAALARLKRLLQSLATPPKPRKATQPTRASVRKRLETKVRRGALKASRRRGGGD